jgi:hypothetical protein
MKHLRSRGRERQCSGRRRRGSGGRVECLVGRGRAGRGPLWRGRRFQRAATRRRHGGCHRRRLQRKRDPPLRFVDDGRLWIHDYCDRERAGRRHCGERGRVAMLTRASLGGHPLPAYRSCRWRWTGLQMSLRATHPHAILRGRKLRLLGARNTRRSAGHVLQPAPAATSHRPRPNDAKCSNKRNQPN